MDRTVKVAVAQFAIKKGQREANLAKGEEMVRKCAAAGANIILLPELFEDNYFAQEMNESNFSLAKSAADNAAVQRLSEVARELQVVLPVSFFERANNAYYNSLAVIDADGSIMGVYRKSHLPQNQGYQDKFYFTPGDTGFQVYNTRYGRLGAAVCWDQWFPEVARCLALQGAEIIIFPTAIGSPPMPSVVGEALTIKDITMRVAGSVLGTPKDPYKNSIPTALVKYQHWIRTQVGQAAANMVPILSTNRIGQESSSIGHIDYFGGSFIAGNKGQILAQIGACKDVENGAFDLNPNRVEGFVTADLNLDMLQFERTSWGLFRDRRPDLYGAITTKDGKVANPVIKAAMDGSH
eukprot:jgi/Chrzof1/14092/Cz08g24250.t1